ncbi:MAG: transcriptional regulator, Crp/Fnr family [Caulobacter sp.]|nr:transcriptional regulator, Crp/Fnr family [Caulobacter sp.]
MAVESDRREADKREAEVAAMLATAEVFAALSDGARLALARAGRPHGLEAGRELCAQGDASDAAYVVLSGELEVLSTTAEGREVWLAALGPGAIVGEMGVLDGGPRSAHMRAVRRTSLWRIGRETVLETLKAEPAAAIALLAEMTRRLRRTDLALHEMAVRGLGARLARLLIAAGGSTLAMPQGEMARQIGASREKVNRKLAAWRDEGWVEMGAYGVRIIDRGALLKVVGGDAPL